MRLVHTILETRGAVGEAAFSKSIGLVPTMGALHAGHARLIETARDQSDFVAVSIFVNPLQFNQREDYERYARTLPADFDLCEQAGADLIFAPSDTEMYPEPPQTTVDVAGVSEHFCGASRPGHFRGVATVVSKLFHIVDPDLAFFGEKDAQQLAVIEAMVRDGNYRVKIVPVPTVREPNGLAMSSRNARLNPAERRAAACLYEALSQVRERIESGDHDTNAILHDARAFLDRPSVRVDYFDLANPATMVPVRSIDSPVLALGAIWVGETRLIDNLMCFPRATRDAPSNGLS